MTWNLISALTLTQDWQVTPPIDASLGYVRLTFDTVNTPIFIAQIDYDSAQIATWDEQRFLSTAYNRIFEFEAPPFFTNRALAIRTVGANLVIVQIEVSDMPLISRGSAPAVIAAAATANVTAVNAATQATALLAANADRKKCIVINESSATLYLAYGEVATTTEYTIALQNGDGYEIEGFTGVVSGIWSSATGKALVTEFQ